MLGDRDNFQNDTGQTTWQEIFRQAHPQTEPKLSKSANEPWSQTLKHVYIC